MSVSEVSIESTSSLSRGSLSSNVSSESDVLVSFKSLRSDSVVLETTLDKTWSFKTKSITCSSRSNISFNSLETKLTSSKESLIDTLDCSIVPTKTPSSTKAFIFSSTISASSLMIFSFSC